MRGDPPWSMPAWSTQPFEPGDVVYTQWPSMDDGAPWWASRVASIQRVTYGESCTGWLVVGAASEPCPHCGAVLHPRTPSLSSAWLRKEKP